MSDKIKDKLIHLLGESELLEADEMKLFLDYCDNVRTNLLKTLIGIQNSKEKTKSVKADLRKIIEIGKKDDDKKNA